MMRGALLPLLAAFTALGGCLGGGGETGAGIGGLVEGQSGSFSAFAVVTPDPDWKAQWSEASRDRTPSFSATDRLGPGETATILVFFSGAGLVDGAFEVLCDIRAEDPGEEVRVTGPVPCATHRPRGALTDIYLTGMLVHLEWEAEDAGGTSRMAIGVTDASTGVRVPLFVEVAYLEESGG